MTMMRPAAGLGVVAGVRGLALGWFGVAPSGAAVPVCGDVAPFSVKPI